jgi:putative endonuclease
MSVGANGVVGRYGEDVAARHLSECGSVVLARNWRSRRGEIDILARDGDVLVVCEVKTRRGEGFGTPLDAVTPAKAGRLRLLAAEWLAGQREQGPFSEIRFDVIGVLRPPSGPALIHHVKGAF